MEQELGRMADATGPSQAEPEDVSALRASAPCARLIELVERCERAAGADREMDVLLAYAIGLIRDSDGHGYYYGAGNNDDYVLERDYYANGGNADELPYFTASFGDALNLLPEGADWRRLTDKSVSTYAANPYNAKAQKRIDGFGKTPALQMCAAALKLILEPLLKAQAIKARRAGPTKIDPVHESAVPKECAQNKDLDHDI